MERYSIVIYEKAKEELKAHYKAGDKGTIKRIEKIFDELAETPFSGTGNPEPLKYELTGKWSRKINKKDRLIYAVKDQQISIYSAKGHYGDD
jgi:toxin YoeB